MTQEQLKLILPKNKEIPEWYSVLMQYLPTYDIVGTKRLTAFMAQTSHESLGYTVLVENLNYSKEALVKLFPKYFTTISAEHYHRQPEKIANHMYANRMSNGSEESGDGWKYRGRGIIQITGKYNYTTCSSKLFKDSRLLETPDLISTKKDVALLAALWFWQSNNLNDLADKEDIVGMTKKINGGTVGLLERDRAYERIKQILGEA